MIALAARGTLSPGAPICLWSFPHFILLSGNGSPRTWASPPSRSARLAGDPGRPTHAHRRAHRLGQDARGVPLGHRRARSRAGTALPDETQVLYVSPLKALANDVQKNLERPLAEIRERRSRACPRSACSCAPATRRPRRAPRCCASRRTSWSPRPSRSTSCSPAKAGGGCCATVRTVIVDEIHALARDKRGSHLALSLERLEALTAERGGPLAAHRALGDAEAARARSAASWSASDRECALVDVGHLRDDRPGDRGPAVAADRGLLARAVGRDLRAHRRADRASTARRWSSSTRASWPSGSPRASADATGRGRGRLPPRQPVARSAGSTPSSGSRRASSSALVATASLELGIDIGDVDLVIQVGATRSIATFLQRVGRSGHGVGRIPKGRLFPLTLDELVEAAALLRAIAARRLDRTPQPGARRSTSSPSRSSPRASCRRRGTRTSSSRCCRRAWPYRDLTRDEFDDVVGVHTDGGRWRCCTATASDGACRAHARARLTAITVGRRDPGHRRLPGDPGARGHVRRHAQRRLRHRVERRRHLPARQHVLADPARRAAASCAWPTPRAQPPTIPFWLGEAPGAHARAVRRDRRRARASARDPTRSQPTEIGCTPRRRVQIADYVARRARACSAPCPTQKRVVLERFFDESGGMQLVVHAPFGGRINRAWGLALRKRFCRGFGFELQAAANEEAIVLSLGPQHSFPLEEVFDFLHPDTVRDVLMQALLDAPMFETRWRWNATRSLLLERMRGRQDGARRRSCACAPTTCSPRAFPRRSPARENAAAGRHRSARWTIRWCAQTIDDCLTEAMDVDGLARGAARPARRVASSDVAVDTPEPSAFAHGILTRAALHVPRRRAARGAPHAGGAARAAARRARPPTSSARSIPTPSRACAKRRGRSRRTPKRCTRRCSGWDTSPTPRRAPWSRWLAELRRAGRVVLEGDRWFAVEASRDPKEILRGRLEALGRSSSDDPLLYELESRGRSCLRGALRRHSRAGASRRLLARIHRYTLDRLRKEIEPVTAAEFLRFLACWQHVDRRAPARRPARRGRGPAPARRVRGARRWRGRRASCPRACAATGASGSTSSRSRARSPGAGSGAAGRARSARTPICLVPREELETWTALAKPARRQRAGRARRARSTTALRARGDVSAGARPRQRGSCRPSSKMGSASWWRAGS